MASIFIQNNRIYISIQVDGKQIKKSTKLNNTRANMKYVQQKLIPKFIQESETSLYKMTISNYIDKFLKEKKHILKQRTYERYSQMIEKWIRPKYGEIKLSELKTSMLKEFINEQFDLGKSAKTVELYRTIFSGILQEAVYDDVLSVNLFKNIKRKKKNKPIITPFSQEEVRQLLDATEGWFHNYIGLATHFGLRSGELLALKWIDITEDHIKIRRTRDLNRDTEPKTASSIRDLPLFESVKPFIEDQRLITGCLEYVFVKRGQVPWSDTQWISQLHWYPLLKKLGLKKRRMYEMRHTFATNMLNSGFFKVTDIAKMMGHSTTEYLFNVYSRYIESEQDKIPLDKSIY
jgi:integrase